jgi:RNA polymerase sigma-70 factor, ECF subfamily
MHIRPFSECVRDSAKRVADNGAHGLAGLYDLTAQRLLRYAVQITRNQHDAEDAVQATLTRVVSDAGLLYRADSPWPYLLQMVRNESLVILRKRRPWAILHSLTDLLTHQPIDEVEKEEEDRAVWLAMRTLPTAQREVVVLKIWEELTFAEIGQILELPAATAASRYRYAIEKLARLLRPAESEVVHE